MEQNKEIAALFHLMDDPDEDVFFSVRNRILSFGKEIIPNLESLSESASCDLANERIEQLIQRLHFDELAKDLEAWAALEGADLLDGALLIARYVYPDLNIEEYKNNVEKIRRSIWLELNSYLTGLEQINVVNKVLFLHNNWKGTELSHQNTEDFLLNRVIENKKGNPVTNGILYQYLCQMLDIPVQVVHLPRQFMLAYFDERAIDLRTGEPAGTQILFYIEPISGQVYAQKDVENYLSRINVSSSTHHFRPMSSRKIIGVLLDELSKCYDKAKTQSKKAELLRLKDILWD